MYVIFESTLGIIKRSGDNTGYVLNAAGLVHTGESFVLNPGTILVVVPQQPEGEGPWPQCQLTFVNSQFNCGAKHQYTAYKLENRWLNKGILIQKGMTLDKILEHSGIGHMMSFTTHKQLIKIKNYDFFQDVSPIEAEASATSPSLPPPTICHCTCKCNKTS